MGLREWLARKAIEQELGPLRDALAQEKAALARQEATMASWVKALGVAFATGAINGLSAGMVDGFSLSKEGILHIVTAAAVGGLTAAAMYLKQSPIPAAPASK